MADEIRILDDPEIIKIAVDKTRRKILELLRLNDLTVAQMASILGKDQSTIYRHVEKLLKAGIIRQSGERKEHHIPEKIYSRTAKIFFLAPGIGAVSKEDVLMKHREGVSAKISKLLDEVGYKGKPEAAEAGNELFFEIDTMISEKIKNLKEGSDINFYRLWKLQTAIVILEMRKNKKLKEKAEAFLECYL